MILYASRYFVRSRAFECPPTAERSAKNKGLRGYASNAIAMMARVKIVQRIGRVIPSCPLRGLSCYQVSRCNFPLLPARYFAGSSVFPVLLQPYGFTCNVSYQSKGCQIHSTRMNRQATCARVLYRGWSATSICQRMATCNSDLRFQDCKVFRQCPWEACLPFRLECVQSDQSVSRYMAGHVAMVLCGSRKDILNNARGGFFEVRPRGVPGSSSAKPRNDKFLLSTLCEILLGRRGRFYGIA